MAAWTILGFVAGTALLIAGAELLVRGASRLALAAGISPLVIGLTVVAFGTSAPELAVTVGSAYTGDTAVALGNVVGSNIFNILFILGLAALLVPLSVDQRLVRLDVPIVIAASLLTLLLSLDGSLGRVDGALLFAGIVAYTLFLALQARRSRAVPPPAASEEEIVPSSGRGGALPNIARIVVGLALLVAGAQGLVRSAVDTATALGVSELVIGLTIVAAGTSLPEVATSVLAGIRGERNIAVGNIVGSNLFNLLAVLGIGSLVAPDGIPVPPGALTFDLPIMIGVAVAALPIFLTGSIARWQGGVLLAYYGAYVAWLILEAAEHPALHEFQQAMTWFVLPLTALTLLVIVARTLRERRDRSPRR